MVYRFADCELDEHLYQLRRNGVSVALEPKVFDVLAYLIQLCDRVVSKDELLDKLWPGQVVSETALTQCVMAARKAVGDDGIHQHTIKTQHGRGYRFVAPLTTLQPVQGSMFQVPGQETEGNQKASGENSRESNVQSLASNEQSPESEERRSSETGQPLDVSASVRTWPSRNLAWLGVVLLVSAGVSLFYFSSLPIPQSAIRNPGEVPSPLPLPDKPSIIVLPFVNLSGDPTQEYFSDGMTEEITAALSRLSSLFVIARTSAFSYKGKAVTVQEVSREMGVRYVLEGSVQKAGEQVRIVAQLIGATTGGHLWSQRYDRPLKDIFALHDEIVQQIVTTLQLQLTLQEQGILMRKRTDNLEAYDTFLRGADHFYHYTKEGNAQARLLLEKAIELDPQYGEAYAYLGWTYLMAWMQQWSSDLQSLQRAFELGQQALALDDALPRAHRMVSAVYTLQTKYEPAVAAAERAIAFDPNDAESYVTLANAFNFSGERTAEAIKLLEQARRLNPRYWFTLPYNFGWAYSLIGRYEEAIAAQKQALLRSPNWLFSHLELALNYQLLWSSQLSHDPQTLDRAFEAAQQMVALNASLPWSHVTLSRAYLWEKQYEQASRETEQALALNPSRGEIYAVLANVLSFLGRSEEALGLAGKAVRLNPRLPPRNLLPLGHTYYLAGRTEEAIAALKKSLNGSPADLDAHLLLAAVYSELGREAEARAEAAVVLRINPRWSLEVWRQRVPYKDPAMLERVFAALRKAGLE